MADIDWSQFKPADAPDQGASVDWSQFKPAPPAGKRGYLGAAAEAGGRSLLAAGATVLDAINPFTTSEQDAAELYKNDPEGFKRFTEKSASAVLQRFAEAQVRKGQDAMRQVNPDQTGAISGKPLGDLKYATTDADEAAYLSPTRVAGDVLQSLPSTLALAVAGYLTRGQATKAAAQAEQAALARGATAIEAQAAAAAAAKEAAAKTMATAGATGEGAVGYGQQAASARVEALDVKPEVYEKSPEYQRLLAEGYAPEVARRKLAAQVGSEAGTSAGLIDAATNLVGGRVLGKVIGEGGKILPRVAKGAATEAATEFVQSAGEQFGQNVAMTAMNPNQALSKDVLESAVAGGVVGGVTGGAVSGMFGSRQPAAGPAPVPDPLDNLNAGLKSAVDVYLRGPTDAQTAASVLSAGSVDQAIAAAEASTGSLFSVAQDKGLSFESVDPLQLAGTAPGAAAPSQLAMPGVAPAGLVRAVDEPAPTALAGTTLGAAPGYTAIPTVAPGVDSLPMTTAPGAAPAPVANLKAGPSGSLVANENTPIEPAGMVRALDDPAPTALAGTTAGAAPGYTAIPAVQPQIEAPELTTSLGAAPAREPGLEMDASPPAPGDEQLSGGKKTKPGEMIPAVPGVPGMPDAMAVNGKGQVGATEQQNATLLADPADPGTEAGRARIAAGYVAPVPPKKEGKKPKASEKRTPAERLTQLGESKSTPERQVTFTEVNPATLGEQRSSGAGELSRQAYGTIKQIARVFGKKVVVFDSSDDRAADGFLYDDEPNTIYINRKAEKPHLVVFGHELMHGLKRNNKAAYDSIAKVVKLKKGVDLNKVAGVEGDTEELISDLQGNRFSESEFWADVFRDLAGETITPTGRQTVMKLAASAMKTVNRLMKALGRPQGYEADDLVENLQQVKLAIKAGLTGYAKQRYTPAQEMDRQDRSQSANSEQAQAPVAQRESGEANVAPEAADDAPFTSEEYQDARRRNYDDYNDEKIDTDEYTRRGEELDARAKRAGLPVFSGKRDGVTRRAVLASALSAAAGETGAALPLGKAKPISEAVLRAELPAPLQAILKGGRRNGVTEPNGAPAILKVMREIAATGPAELRGLAGKVAAMLPTDGVMLTIEGGQWNGNGGVQWSGGLTRMRLMADMQGMTYATFIHEALHLVVLARYQSISTGNSERNNKRWGTNNPVAAKQLKQLTQLWDEFEVAYKKNPPKDFRMEVPLKEAFAKPDEFFVRALTDPLVQQYMAGIEYEGKTLLERFKDWVTGLFIKSGTRPSWLDAALLASTELLDAMPADAGDFKRMRAATSSAEQKDAVRFSDKRNPFYSALDQQLSNLKTAAAPAAGWKDAIKGLVAKGLVKADEVEWTGVNEWLDLQQGKVTKQAVQDYLKANGVRVDETVLSREGKPNNDEWEPDDGLVGNTRYGGYQLPGGKNYRELLLTLPENKPNSALDDYNKTLFDKYGEGAGLADLTADEIEKLRQLQRESRAVKGSNYQSSHWDQPNVLAHIRVNDRTDADGAKVLFVEEIQSDWAQEGKKKGFAAPPPAAEELRRMEEELTALKARRRELVAADRESGRDQVNEETERVLDQETELQARLNQARRASEQGTPRAPFVDKTDKWVNLALKRIVKLAVDEGYDKVAFVNGDQSAERYDLSKQVGSVRWASKPGSETGTLTVKDTNGNRVLREQTMSPMKAAVLEDFVGKEVARKLLESPVQSTTPSGDEIRQLSGLDLKVGGEGMKAFYDKIVPAAVKGMLKKLGGRELTAVGVSTAPDLSTTPDDLLVRINQTSNGQFRVGVGAGENRRAETFPTREQAQAWADAEVAAARRGRTTTQPGFEVTDAMREKAGPGLPLFSKKRENTNDEQTRDRSGRETTRSLAPLAGAPAVRGFSGPDPRLVEVAERYARDQGIDLKRQAEYVQVDEDRARRIAAAYDAMSHAPGDPRVKAAYDALAEQTLAQYQALADAGYKFWFIDTDIPSNAEYASSPWNAMRDVRANKEMGVFPTNDGFGSSDEFSPEANPLLADTGLEWPVGGPDGQLQPVLFNDLFRAVHDAFGHGLEGAGFRAQGEENAWQAHIRLFTGAAKGAITTETRGQNSWLNYGPHGEKNRTAAVEDTVFADQKTGLMPEWTWQEGIAGDMPVESAKRAGPRNLLLERLGEVGVRNKDDFWDMWKHYLLYGDVQPSGLSQVGAKASAVERIEQAIPVWRNDADQYGFEKTLQSYGHLRDGARTPVDEDGLIYAAAPRMILTVAGIRPTLDNALAAYDALPARPDTAANDSVSASAKRNQLDPDIVQALGKHIRNLTPPERAKLRRDTARKLVTTIESLPSANEMAAVAFAGRAKRGWYYNSARAIEHVFGGDAPRFAALLAAMSPQCSVETNLYNTLSTWKNWVRAGRPTDRESIIEVMGESVQGGRGRASVLDAWINNSVRALSSADPSEITLSGPKVNSFMLNLRGVVDEVTNDAWMSNYALVDQKIFAGELTKGGDPGKGTGYLAMSAQVRAAAKTLTRMTGEEWTPAEVQETIWSWAKTLYESASMSRSAEDIVLNREVSDELIQSTPDFRTLFHDDVNEQFLRDAGLGDRVDTLRRRSDLGGAGTEGRRAEGEAAPFAGDAQLRYELRAAKRLDKLRERGNVVAEDEPVESAKRLFADSGRKYTPEQLAAFERTGRVVTERSLLERADALKTDWKKKLAQGLVDQFAPIQDLGAPGKAAYALARLSKGSTGAVEALMHHGKLSVTADGVYDADRSGGVVDRLFAPLAGETADFLSWLSAKRAEMLLAQDREKLFTPADIAALKRLDEGTTKFDYTLQHGPRAGQVTRDRTLIYADALKTFNEFNKNVLDIAEKSGLIDKTTRPFWEHEFYVPFYRQNDDGTFSGASIKDGLVRQKAFERLKGGTSQLKSDLLSNVLQNWAHLIDAGAKNRAALATIDAAQAMHIAYSVPAQTKGAVWVMRDGHAEHYAVEDPYTLKAISSISYAGMKGFGWDMLTAPKRWLTIGVTASPAFKVRNLIRDSISAIGVSELSPNVLKNLKQGWKASDKDTQTYVSSLAGGGLIRFGTMLEGRQADRVRQLVKQARRDGHMLDSESSIRKFYDLYLEPAVAAYNELGNRSEEVNRSALYKQLVDKGVPPAQANLAARDLMDFSMMGAWGAVRFLTQVVPFLNARIQGLYKLGRGAAENPAKFSMLLGAVALAGIALSAAYSDDDDWKKREDWDKNGFWWFKIGGVAYRIPKPFEIGAIATLAERGIEFAYDPDMTGKRYAKIVRDLLMDNLAMNPVPQAVKPIIDLYANYDSFTGRPIENLSMQRLRPEYRMTAGTSMTARGVSTAGNAVANAVGSKFLSPVQVDHLIDGYFGWLGSFVMFAPELILREATDQPTRPARDLYKFATQGIVQETTSGSSYYVSTLYKQAEEIEKAYATWRQLQKEGKGVEAMEFFADHQDKIAKYKSISKVKDGEARFNEMIRAIERSTKLDTDEKKERIIRLRQQQDQLARTLTAAR